MLSKHLQLKNKLTFYDFMFSAFLSESFSMFEIRCFSDKYFLVYISEIFWFSCIIFDFRIDCIAI